MKSSEQLDWEFFIKDKLYSVLRNDDKEGFVDMMNSLSNKLEVFPAEILSAICHEEAREIAASVFNGETGIKVDVNAVNPITNLPILHFAAYAGNVDMVDSLLRHGAHTDVRCNCENSEQFMDINGMTPLNVALHRMSKGIDEFLANWSSKQSLFNMIIRLCLPFATRGKREIVKLLAWTTEGIEYEIYRYAKEGKVVELAALLLVAREKVMSPSIFEKVGNFSWPHESTTLRQYISYEIASLTALHTRLVHETGNHAFLQTCNDKRASMKSMLVLLEIFERAGDDITAYIEQSESESNIEVARGVAWLIQEADFSFKYADIDILDINCDNGGMGQLPDEVDREIEKEKSIGIPLPDCMDLSDFPRRRKGGKEDFWNITVNAGKLLAIKNMTTNVTGNSFGNKNLPTQSYHTLRCLNASTSSGFAMRVEAKNTIQSYGSTIMGKISTEQAVCLCCIRCYSATSKTCISSK
ncbi:Ankyrin repeat family protein [Quillaja saponaria]|uniref:Ankyrin repeat family protein n=1 Tax=Quillaja saponaria TaxID=32244 RepID=A0AAD7Q6Z1_QUISA|nr:Ankyrin repeat family protein [Quillaja saponaria]KAJ7975602.1 Ankyrin repeat family protein [Quillaja saponaria]